METSIIEFVNEEEETVTFSRPTGDIAAATVSLAGRLSQPEHRENDLDAERAAEGKVLYQGRKVDF